jgi:hypothetical protein
MNDDDVWGGEMPNLPFRRRHGDPADAPQLDELLDAGRLDAASYMAPAPEWQSVSDLLRSAAAAAEPSELAGEAAVLATFRRERAGIRHRRPQPIARCKTMFSTLLTGRLAAGLIAGVVTVTGAATAAYACVLPSPIQNFAHDTIGAPAKSGSTTTAALVAAEKVKEADDSADPSVIPTVTPSVSATASASVLGSEAKKDDPKKSDVAAAVAAFQQKVLVHRLCRDYAAATTAGKTLDAKALAVLVKAAGTEAAITAYCTALPVLPTTCVRGPLGTTTATATSTASATPLDPSKRFGPWCGVCPALKATTTATATATATADPDGDANKDGKDGMNDGDFGFWCDNPGHHIDPKVLPLPTTAIRHDTVNSRDPGHAGFGTDGGSNNGGSNNGGSNNGGGQFQGHNHN